ncbi:hypothetical protein BGZ83_006889 [Gryganskiella cystojenkinii]|nr:hypothetical protein BGZ83_006889 [Gryganskiella cystojenkinii]
MDRALGIVDIRRAIGEFLDSKSIIECACVNHDWHATFIPFLWQSLEFGKTYERYPPSSSYSKTPKTYPPIQALEQNKHLVQRLSIISCNHAAYLRLQGFQQLSYLSLSGSAIYSNRDIDSSSERTVIPPRDAPDMFTPWYHWRLLVQHHQSSLKVLSVQPDLKVPMTEQFLKAIMGCERLETLKLHACTIPTKYAGIFWKSISKVEHLHWRGGGSEFPDWIQQSDEAGLDGNPPLPPQLPPYGSEPETETESSFISSNTNSLLSKKPPAPEPAILYTSQSPPPSSLRTLVIKQCGEKLTDLRLFQFCRNLERISWEQLRGNWLFPLEPFGDLLYESSHSAAADKVTGGLPGNKALAITSTTTWPKLQELEILNSVRYSSDTQWARVMESPLGRRLKILKVHDSKIGPKTLNALFACGSTNPLGGTKSEGQNQDQGQDPTLGGMAISLPTEMTSTNWLNKSLTVIDLLPTQGLNSLAVQAILSKLTALEVLRVGRIWYMDIVEGEPWVCKNLRELCISIDMTPLSTTTMSTPDPATSLPPVYGEDEDVVQLPQSLLPPAPPCTPEFEIDQRQVFDRLSTLNRLNVLILHQKRDSFIHDREEYRTLNMTLAAGLNKLETLKHLSSLTFTSSHQNMGWDEIQWMCQIWPGMRRLTGKFSKEPQMHYALKRHLNQHHVLVCDP